MELVLVFITDFFNLPGQRVIRIESAPGEILLNTFELEKIIQHFQINTYQLFTKYFLMFCLRSKHENAIIKILFMYNLSCVYALQSIAAKAIIEQSQR